MAKRTQLYIGWLINVERPLKVAIVPSVFEKALERYKYFLRWGRGVRDGRVYIVGIKVNHTKKPMKPPTYVILIPSEERMAHDKYHEIKDQLDSLVYDKGLRVY